MYEWLEPAYKPKMERIAAANRAPGIIGRGCELNLPDEKRAIPSTRSFPAHLC